MTSRAPGWTVFALQTQLLPVCLKFKIWEMHQKPILDLSPSDRLQSSNKAQLLMPLTPVVYFSAASELVPLKTQLDWMLGSR